MSHFKELGVYVESKPTETRLLYHMMLLYLDQDELIYPAAARTASLIGFLRNSFGVSPESAQEVEGYMAAEILRNNLGLQTIRDELAEAINRRATAYAAKNKTA